MSVDLTTMQRLDFCKIELSVTTVIDRARPLALKNSRNGFATIHAEGLRTAAKHQGGS